MNILQRDELVVYSIQDASAPREIKVHRNENKALGDER